VPGTATSASSANAPQPSTPSTTAAADQLATPPGPGQVINPADQARTKMQPQGTNVAAAKVPNAPSSVGGFNKGMRRVSL
jgi:hypothetical protein